MTAPLGIHQIAAKEIPRGKAATIIQGILGPHLDFVLSLNQPINGSFMASHIFINISNEPAIKTGNPAEQIKNLKRKKPNCVAAKPVPASPSPYESINLVLDPVIFFECEFSNLFMLLIV